jgi:hypothetical protein
MSQQFSLRFNEFPIPATSHDMEGSNSSRALGAGCRGGALRVHRGPSHRRAFPPRLFRRAYSVDVVHPAGGGTDYARSLAIENALVVLAARAAALG